MGSLMKPVFTVLCTGRKGRIMQLRNSNVRCLFALFVCFWWMSAARVPAQVKPALDAAASTAKAEEIIKNAVNALGGAGYLALKNVTGRGLYTPYREEGAGLPSKFTDFIIWPDRERTEFKNSNEKFIQTNTGDTGWLYSGLSKATKDLTPAQVADFKIYTRTTLDNLLRGFWRKEGAQISYAGRREAGIGKRNETVKLTYKDGFEIEYEFGAKDFLPAKAVYRKADAQGVTDLEEDRYGQFVNLNGVNAPFVIDHYRAGKQTSRVNYESIEYNRALPDALFAKPADAKTVKFN